MSKPSIPQGTRDFNPETVRKRQFILQTIREVFEIYGYQPLETPAMENLETLMGKYGEEGDKLIFKVLNNGLDNPAKHQQAKEDFEKVLQGKNVRSLTERALRYDLTIPFARFVAMNHGQLTFPFKRYQMQPVWRADRPQKGRYREFWQCDADVVGSNSLLNEAELASIYALAFSRLRIPVEIRINNRKILAALAEACGSSGRITNITVAIDKLDKIGLEKVLEELATKELTATSINLVKEYLQLAGKGTADTLLSLKNLLGHTVTGQQGIEEMEQLLELLQAGYPATISSISIDPTLARGLDYYTGAIFEVKAVGVAMGSIGGGGRYNDLTGLFGVPGIPGVGISFGVDRIYDVMESSELFPASVEISTQALFFHLGEKESIHSIQLMQSLREKGIRCELFHENSKFDKQFKYAEKKGIPYVIILGSQELAEGTVVVKDLTKGQQVTVQQETLKDYPF